MASPELRLAIKPVILCVEDNEVYLRLPKAVLEQAGYTVLSATTPAEAMEILRDAPVSLVLSDHMLRGTTGTFLAKQMKRIKRKVPIILYSGKPPESLRNVDGFINKDESVPRFLSLVGDFVKRYIE
jgi:CheY-like chemotaxis protein